MTRFLLNPKLTPQERYLVVSIAIELKQIQNEMLIDGLNAHHKFVPVDKLENGEEKVVDL